MKKYCFPFFSLVGVIALLITIEYMSGRSVFWPGGKFGWWDGIFGEVKILSESRISIHSHTSYMTFSFIGFWPLWKKFQWSGNFSLLSFLKLLGKFSKILLSSSIVIENQRLLKDISVIVSSIPWVILLWWR